MDSSVEVPKGRKRPPPAIMGSGGQPDPPNEKNRDLLTAKRGRHVHAVPPATDSQQSSDMVDEDGFQSVTHRRNRKQGVPLVIRPSANGDLRKTNPKRLHTEIVKAAGETPTRITLTKSGAITIDVRTDAAVNRLLATTDLADTAVESYIPAAYMGNTASIRGVPSGYTDEELEEYLRDQGVIKARRRHRRGEGNPPALIPTNEVLLHFAPNTERPERIDLGFWHPRVHEKITPPPRCYRCQHYGHISRVCRKTTPTCSICSGEHDWKECPTPNQPLCANCKGAHPAVDRTCPSRATATRRKIAFVNGSAPPLPIRPKLRNNGFAEKPQVLPGGTQRQQKKKYTQPGGPAPVDSVTPVDGRSYLQVALQDSVIHADASLTRAQQLQRQQQLEKARMERMHAIQQQELKEYERQATRQPQRQQISETSQDAASTTQLRMTMETLLETLLTVLQTLHGVAAKLPAGDAKVDLLTLTGMMTPLSALAGEIVKHG